MNIEIEAAQLKEWMREKSPLNEYSSTIRAEEASPTQEATEAQPADPFAGIDFDDLPDDIRTKLATAKEEFGKRQTALQELTEKQTRLEHFARQQQSQAAKLQATLQKHNLNPDGPTTNPDDPSSDPAYSEYMDLFRRQGLPDAQAEAMAKMWVGAGKVQQTHLMRQFGQSINPLVQSVGNLRADQILADQIERDQDGILAIPEIQKGVRDALTVVVKNGNPVTPEVIDHLTNMQYGLYMRNGGGKTATQRPTPYVASPLATVGGHYVPSNMPKPTGPVAANDDTARAANAVASALNALIGKGGKKR